MVKLPCDTIHIWPEKDRVSPSISLRNIQLWRGLHDDKVYCLDTLYGEHIVLSVRLSRCESGRGIDLDFLGRQLEFRYKYVFRLELRLYISDKGNRRYSVIAFMDDDSQMIGSLRFKAGVVTWNEETTNCDDLMKYYTRLAVLGESRRIL